MPYRKKLNYAAANKMLSDADYIANAKPLVKRKPKPVSDYKKNTVKLIKQVMTRQEEKKIDLFRTTFTQVGNSTSSVWSTNNAFPLSPYTTLGIDIAQGTGQSGRIGNKIRVVSNILRYTIYPNPYNVTNNALPQPQDFRMWFFSNKNSNVLPSTPPTQFFQGDNADQAFTGNIADLNRIVNTDLFTYLGHRTHKVGFAGFLPAGGVSVGSSSTYAGYANNDYKLNIQGYVDVTKYMPKVIKFDDGTGNNTPVSKCIFCIMETVNSDGSTMSTVTYPLQFDYQLTLKYTDA